jgi:hypothetical protein
MSECEKSTLKSMLGVSELSIEGVSDMSAGDNFDRQYRVAIGKAGQAGFEIGHTSNSQPPERATL